MAIETHTVTVLDDHHPVRVVTVDTPWGRVTLRAQTFQYGDDGDRMDELAIHADFGEHPVVVSLTGLDGHTRYFEPEED